MNQQNGLDVEGIIEIRNLIKQLANQGIAILISSHNLTEIDNLCNRIIGIKNGKMIADDTIENFKMISNESCYIFNINSMDNIEQVLLGYRYELLNNNNIRVYISKNEVSSLMQKILENQYQIYSVTEEQFTSEEAFIKKEGDNKID